MALRRKVGLVLLMGLSFITAAGGATKVAIIIVNLSGSPLLGTGARNYYVGVVYLASGVEECLVLIMGCIPTLRPLAKLKFPGFSDIGSSIASLIPRARRKNSASTLASAYGGHVAYQDLELQQPKLRSSDDGSYAVTATVITSSSREKYQGP